MNENRNAPDASAREARFRRAVSGLGFALRKDRTRTWSLDRLGGYGVVDPPRNGTVAGERFDPALDAAEAWL